MAVEKKMKKVKEAFPKDRVQNSPIQDADWSGQMVGRVVWEMAADEYGASFRQDELLQN